MGTLHITAFARDIRHSSTLVRRTIDGGHQEVTTDAVTSSQSAAMPAGVQIAELICGENVHVVVGSDPTATTSDHMVAANTPTLIAINGGQKIAAIDNT